MVNKNLICFFLLIISLGITTVYGQGHNTLIMDLGVKSDFYNEMNKSSANVKGTPFLFENFEKGRLILSNGQILDDISFNIYLEKNEIYVRQDESNGEIIANNKQISKIIPTTSDVVALELKKFNGRNQFVEVIYESDELTLIREHNKKFTKASSSGASTYETKSANMDQYTYIKRTYLVKNGETIEIKPGNAGYKILGEESWKKLRDYANSKNLDISKSKDLQEIFLQANSY